MFWFATCGPRAGEGLGTFLPTRKARKGFSQERQQPRNQGKAEFTHEVARGRL